MKNRLFKQLVFTLTLLLYGISLSAQQAEVTVPAISELEAALKAKYSATEIAAITDLKVSTPAGVYLGSADLAYLNAMPKLAKLDLSDSRTTGVDNRTDDGFPRNAFANNTSIKTFIFPKNAVSLSRGLFTNSALEGVITLPKGIVTVTEYNMTFEGCRGITGFVVESGNTKLKAVDGVLYTIDGTSLLVYPYGKQTTSFSIPEGVTTLGTSAFGWNNYLEELSFPASLVNLPRQDLIVNGSTKIKKYNVAAGNTVLASTNGFLVDKTTGTLMAFPPGNTDETIIIDGSIVKIVPSGYFSYAVANLKNIVFTEGVESIGYTAFKIGNNVTSKLEYVELPSTLKNIDGEAFVGNANLLQVICKATTPPTLAANQIFRGSNGKDVRLGVPATALAAYKASTWNISNSAGTNAFPADQMVAYSKITMVDGTCAQSASVPGYSVPVKAGDSPEGKAFFSWTSTPETTFANPKVVNTSFVMTSSDITVKALFADKKPYTLVDAITPSGTAAIGSSVNIEAAPTKGGATFRRWEVMEGTGVVIDSPNSTSSSFTMTDGPVKIAAVYATAYTVNICGGYAVLEAFQGDVVTVKASKRSDETFKRWTASTPGVVFENGNNEITTFTMPASAVTIDAIFE